MKKLILRIAFGVLILIFSIGLFASLSMSELDTKYKRSRTAVLDHMKRSEKYGLKPPARVLIERIRLSTDYLESSLNTGSKEGRVEALKIIQRSTTILSYMERSGEGPPP